ncbi:hypothetical protein Tco_0580084 [Tanacetum coccineum]
MLHIITLLAMASVVELGIYLAYVPYEEESQYLAFILAILMPLIVLAIGVDLFWKEWILLLGEGCESSLIPSNSRCPTISSYVAKLLAISALYSTWSIMVKIALVAQSDLIFSGGGGNDEGSNDEGNNDEGSNDEGSAAANSVMHALADGDHGVWC